MVSSRMPSMIERSPRAPVLRSIALRAMAPSASSARVRSIDSISNSRWYCFTSAFLGWVRMSLRDGSSRSSSVATTGSRPTNSGMRPYFKRCGSGKPFRGADSALSPASVGYPDACDGRDSDARLRINGTMRALLGALREWTPAGVCDPHADNLGRSAAGHYPLDLRGRELGADHVG